MNNDKILDLAKKLYELSKRGESGEKENAASKLESVMKKYGITMDMLSDDEMKERVFLAEDGLERKFLWQIMSSVVGERSTFYSKADSKKKKKRVFVKLTDIEFIEISEKFDFYWQKYNEDVMIFYKAFIQKNHLYKKLSENQSTDKELTAEQKEEVMKTLRMMEGIQHHTHRKMLENQ